MPPESSPQRYKPISCSAYDVLESSAVLRHHLELHLSDGTTVQGRVIDVYAKGEEEFCTLTSTSDSPPQAPIRLDAILRIVDLTEGKEYATQSC